MSLPSKPSKLKSLIVPLVRIDDSDTNSPKDEN